MSKKEYAIFAKLCEIIEEHLAKLLVPCYTYKR